MQRRYYRLARQDVWHRQVIDFYHETLKQNPEGLEYLQRRSLKNPDMIDRFKLGLSNRTLCYDWVY